MKTTTLNITGMTCASCVAHIQDGLKTLDGVESCEVNFAMEKGQVTYDDAKLKPKDLIAKVKEVGYIAVIADEHSGHHKKEHHQDHGMSQHEGHDMSSHADHGEDHSRHAKAESDQRIQELWRKFVVGFVLSIVILPLTFVWKVENGMEIMMVLSLAILLYSGREFFERGIPNLIKGRPQMDTLVALGVGAAFLYSSYVTLFTDVHEEYFMDVAIIATFIILGRYLEAKAKGSASAAIKKLMELSAKVAHRVKMDGSVEDIPIDRVQVGDLLRVKPGEKVPVDGLITEGEGTLDESMVTGESIPVDKKEGDHVIGATINGNTTFVMEAQKVGSDTMLAHIVKLVEQAQMSKAPIQKLVDIISGYFVWAVITIATIAFLVWIFVIGVDPSRALIITVAILIIACPCALGLATPISIVVGSGKGAELGILIKNSATLEKAHKITAVAFDKTGTITEGKPKVTDFILYEVPEGAESSFFLDKISPQQNKEYKAKIVHYIASLEHQSEHPLGKAVIDHAGREDFIDFKNVTAVIGKGIMGTANQHKVLIGNKGFMEAEKVMRCAALDEQADELASDGKTVLFFAIDGKQRGILALQDGEKKTSKQAIQLLHKRGVKTIMITGDNEKVAKSIAKQVGIDEIHAQVPPEQKTEIIKGLQAKGLFVAMVGDGINDSPALAQADVGIAMGTGTDVAMETGDLVLVKGDLMKAVEAIDLSRATLRNIKQNLFWAFIYNSVGIPVAALGLLNPAFSAGAMAFSSLSVVLNALRLKRFKTHP
jgi:P-type Cu+ transporter